MDEQKIKQFVYMNMTAAFVCGGCLGAAIMCKQAGYQEAGLMLVFVSLAICLFMQLRNEKKAPTSWH